MADSIDILIGVGIGIIMFFILLCGLHNCFCKDSPTTGSSISSTRNTSLSVNNRVQIDNFSLGYSENSGFRFERTEDL